MTLPRYNFGNRCVGQPTIAGVGDIVTIPAGGIVSAEVDPNWTYEKVRARGIALCQARGTTNAVVDWEADQDLTTVTRLSADLAAAGIQAWWYTPCTINDTIWAAALLESDRDRYSAWLTHLRTLKLPRGVNVAYDLYRRDIDDLNGLYWERITETARAMVEVYPDARILPVVWHHEDTDERRIVRAETFRAMIRFAVRWHGRVSYWTEPPDTDRSWDVARTDRYTRIFLEEAGVVA